MNQEKYNSINYNR